jgi:cellulose synthase/poly-beta-1,6-N-acetylglucosamine synthase-like glycosyltransferase
VTTVAICSVWVAVFLIAYVYAGYPLLLWLLTRRWSKGVYQGNITPSITVLISAYNEAQVIRAKLENTLALEYPRELLEVIVISDASTDGTDQIVESFAHRGVKLLGMSQRGGKTVGLNAAIKQAQGDIVLFSDANILYEPDVAQRLVRNFAEHDVGCVTGNSCYAESSNSASHVQERSYWHYEQMIRAWESQLGSTVGGDGAIFAIRREFYEPLAPEAINDLVIPLQIVARGYRAVFEPEAIGFEPSAGDFGGEFRRKRRIVNRSWRGVLNVPKVLNPWATGLFAWQVWSHKMLRWLVFPMVLIAATGCIFAFSAGIIYQIGAFFFLASVVIAVVGGFRRDCAGWVARLAQALFYFYIVNLAAFLGILLAMFGSVQVVWTPERR